MPAHDDETGIGPVQRDCICLVRAPDAPHIADCNRRFRAKFFGLWRHHRQLFYES
jgi:hypothetical protein